MENKNPQFSIDIDGNELVHSIAYKGTDLKVKEVTSKLNDHFYKRNVNEVLDTDQAKMFDLVGFKLESLSLDILLGSIREQIYDYKGVVSGLLKAKNAKAYDLLCRCKGITYKDLDELYLKQKGDRKQVLLESEVSGVCGSCKLDFNSYFSKLEEEKSFINGENSTIWISRIDKSIDEFYFVCPPEYTNLKFEVISITVHALKIKCIRGDSTLKRPQIQATIENFLKSELKLEMPIKIIV